MRIGVQYTCKVQERKALAMMIVQVLDKFGHAVARKECRTVQFAESWIAKRFPDLDRRGFTVEIFCGNDVCNDLI